MNPTDFFSTSTYIYLPTVKNPKVALAVDNSFLVKNAFKLYNPFSAKAIFLKAISQFLFLKVNRFLKMIVPTLKKEKTEFIYYLESKLKKELVVSIYFATSNDKVVLQLQAKNKIIGYLKFPLNDLGIKHIKNENRAIEILSKKSIVESVVLYDHYKEVPYLFLKELRGKVTEVKKQDLEILLQKFKKKIKFRLKDHPRILQLKMKLIKIDLQNYSYILEELCILSKEYYLEVYEHGDFAPWNIITVNNKTFPFDFEYFEENGLEHMDLIKYYYQIGHLLHKFSRDKLVDFICNKSEISETVILTQIFLIKEIVRKKEENQPFSFEKETLEYLMDAKV
jgi:hypothetical protein